MQIGYTFIDPLVVLVGTGMAIWFLLKNPMKLMGYMPAALSLYFIAPFVTLLTLWQTVPLLLLGRVFVKSGLRAAPFVQPVLMLFVGILLVSASYALIAGSDSTRVVLRSLYYLGIISIFSFSYEMGRRAECYEVFLKGLVITGMVLAIYGIYQIIAFNTGLPVRLIVRGTFGVDAGFENGILRINSFASEPKRLGYVLFVCGLACFFLAQLRPAKARRLKWTGYGIFATSIFTFAGSYFAAIAVFTPVAFLLYPSRITKFLLSALFGVGALIVLFPDLGIVDAIQIGTDRRATEIEIGLDGAVVYRQEFYAWDYLANHPLSAALGVGLGQYFTTLSQEYGIGVGMSERGALIPLNSGFLEMVFDLSGLAAALFYLAVSILIWRLRRAGETFLCLAILFLAIQSATILTLQFIVLFAGIATARLAKHRIVLGTKDNTA